MTPTQPAETRESAVGAQPRRIVLNRIRGQIGVWNVVAARIDVSRELPEQYPVTLACPKPDGRGSGKQRIDRLPRLIRARRIAEDPAIGHHAHETTEHEIGQTER